MRSLSGQIQEQHIEEKHMGELKEGWQHFKKFIDVHAALFYPVGVPGLVCT